MGASPSSTISWPPRDMPTSCLKIVLRFALVRVLLTETYERQV